MIWNKNDIRFARKTPLLVILKKLGYQLRPLEYENYLVEKFGSLIVKHNFWFWKENRQSGNTIDFFVKIEKKSFKEAMTIIQKYK